MTHPTRSELEQWRDGGPTADGEHILGHLAACAQCAAAYAEIVRTRPVTEAPAAFNPRDFVQAGYGAYRRTSAPDRSPWWASRVAYVAAAASIVLAAMIVPTWLRNRSESTARGGGPPLVLVSPVDSSVAVQDLVFEWKANAGVDRVRLFVVAIDDPAKPLIDREVTGSRYEPASEERSRLQSGRELHWFLEYRDGTATATSPSARFRPR